MPLLIKLTCKSKTKSYKTWDKLLTITGTNYWKQEPASCQNFDEKQ